MADTVTPPSTAPQPTPATLVPDRKLLLNDLEPVIIDIRRRAEMIHQRWLLNHAAWRGKHTRTFYKSSIFNHFLPAARQALGRYTIKVARMLVPTPEFFEVFPGSDVQPDLGKGAESIRAWMVYLWTKRIKAYSLVRRLTRNYALYGRAVAKATLKVEPGDDGGRLIWPHVRDVDPFLFYLWPETASGVEDASLVFEDNMMPWETYQEAVQLGVADTIFRSDLTKPEWPRYSALRLQTDGLVEPSTMRSLDSRPDESKHPEENFVALSEAYKREEFGWRRVWVVWNLVGGPRVTRVGEKLLPRPPYRMAVDRQVTGEHYSTSLMDDLEPSQVLLNDQINVTLEGQAFGQAPPTAVDPSRVRRKDTLIYRPRAIWHMDPEGVKFAPAQDVSPLGYRGIAFTLSWIDRAASGGGLAEGQPTRNMPRGSFAVSSLLNLATADIQDAAQMIEDEILTPLLADVHRLTVLHVPDSQLLKVPGTHHYPKGQTLQKRDLAGDWDFQWVGSLQSQDFQVRSQRLVAILQTLGTMAPMLMEDLELRGKRINWTALLQRLWRDAAGERGADSIIEDIPPQEMIVRQIERLMRQIGAGQVQAAHQQKQREGMGLGNVPQPPSDGQGVMEQFAGTMGA